MAAADVRKGSRCLVVWDMERVFATMLDTSSPCHFVEIKWALGQF